MSYLYHREGDDADIYSMDIFAVHALAGVVGVLMTGL
jgi:ammonia channel protein AmtB